MLFPSNRYNFHGNRCAFYDDVYVRNEFHFSEVYRSVNYIGPRAISMNRCASYDDVYVRKELFHFSEIYRNVYYIGSSAK